MRVDVWSDVVCPWCFIGLANLTAAIAEFELGDQVEVVLHSYQLDPGAPEVDDQSLEQRLATKYGTTVEQIRIQNERIAALGAERGIDFRFDKAQRGNTFDAHRLLHLARVHGDQLALKQRLGQAYFTDGEPIGDPNTLRKAAIDVGLDADQVEAVLIGDAYANEVREDIEAAQQIGVAGVPFFVIDGRLGVSGAQPPEVMLDMLNQAAANPSP